ncbi:MAG: hypothetical protein Q9161_009718 [Pseudevernia consocians]
MPSTQNPPSQPHSVNLSQFEMSIAQAIEEKPHGEWSCKLCNTMFNSIMRVVTHVLTSCDEDVATFSNKSAIHLCMVFDEPGSIKMLETFLRLAEDDTLSEGDHEQNERDKEGIGHGNDNHVSTAHNKDMKSEQRTRPPKNQEFPATPPASLSAYQQAEWTFKRNRAAEIRRIVEASIQPNGKIDKALTVTTWNARTHRKSWKSDAKPASPYKNHAVLAVVYAIPPPDGIASFA